jgi:hypothetical protein
MRVLVTPGIEGLWVWVSRGLWCVGAFRGRGCWSVLGGCVFGGGWGLRVQRVWRLGGLEGVGGFVALKRWGVAECAGGGSGWLCGGAGVGGWVGGLVGGRVGGVGG